MHGLSLFVIVCVWVCACLLALQDFVEPSESVLKKLNVGPVKLAPQLSWVESQNYLPLNVSYQLLAGAPSNQKSESKCWFMLLLMFNLASSGRSYTAGALTNTCLQV